MDYSTSRGVLTSWLIIDERRNIGTSAAQNVLLVFVQSAGIHIIWTLLFGISHELHSNLEDMAFDIAPAVCGITEMLVHRLVAAKFGDEAIACTGQSSAIVFAHVRRVNEPEIEGGSGVDN
ncbi:hypothetical protein B0H14DRAFT_3516639 [Mycena olivaceomarginata]|nr:hypothetical protein B0H14DRAFT_3516639 [Mycena olivaceomarginata]